MALLAVAAGLAFVGCDSGGSDDAAEPEAMPAPPTPTPPASTVPPLAATAVNIDDGHAVGSLYWQDGDTSSGGAGQDVAGLSCGDMVETYHVHSHVSVFLNGEALRFPSHVGIAEQSPTSECTYSIHTHDGSGKIHVEGPVPALFTVGQLFQIWGQPLERTNIAGLVGLPVVVYLTDDGVATEYTGDLAAIELKSHREITFQVGTAITTIPVFTWAAN